MGNCILKPIIYSVVALLLFSCNEANNDASVANDSIQPNVACYDLDSLPDDLRLVLLLDLSEQNLDTVPDVVFNLPNLQILNLSSNRISDLSGLEALTELQILNIGNNNFTSFPIEITRLTNLKSLSVYWNDFERFPDEFYQKNQQIEELNMTSLWKFDFKTCLPKVLHMPNLKKLNLGNGPVNLEDSDFGVCTNLQELGIIRQDSIDLNLLFEQLAHCPNFRIVHLSDNNIYNLPPSIVKLTSLEELNLFQNNVATLPFEITSMQQLKEITLIDNPVDTLRIKPIEASLRSTQIIY